LQKGGAWPQGPQEAVAAGKKQSAERVKNACAVVNAIKGKIRHVAKINILGRGRRNGVKGCGNGVKRRRNGVKGCGNGVKRRRNGVREHANAGVREHANAGVRFVINIYFCIYNICLEVKNKTEENY
jgi:hypothetical protein